MKKLFSILLIAVLFIPSMMLFSACGKNKGYDLSNLSTDFYSIADKNNNIVKVANKLKFDYSQHQISGALTLPRNGNRRILRIRKIRTHR